MSLTDEPIEGERQRYTVVRELGRGAFGITCEVVGEDGERYVAKLLRPELLEDWKALELFERELETLASLDHPAIPRHVDRAVDESGTPRALIMERAPGRTLDALIQAHASLSAEELERMARQLLEALDVLHSRLPPVLHRDIKPENLLDDGAQLSLVDFGAVALWTQGGASTSKTSVGTFGYMAPEHQLGRAEPASDLYSAGVTLLVLASHLPPEALPLDPDTGELDVQRAAPGLPEHLRELIHHMTRRGVRARLPSARWGLKRLSARSADTSDDTPATTPTTPDALAKLTAAARAPKPTPSPSPATPLARGDRVVLPAKPAEAPETVEIDGDPAGSFVVNVVLTVVILGGTIGALLIKRSCDEHERKISFHRLSTTEVRKIQSAIATQLIARLQHAEATREADAQMAITGAHEGRRWGIRLDSSGGAHLYLASADPKLAAPWSRALDNLQLQRAPLPHASEATWRAKLPKADRFDRRDKQHTWRYYPHPGVFSQQNTRADEQTFISHQRALLAIIPQPERDRLLGAIASDELQHVRFDETSAGVLRSERGSPKVDVSLSLHNVQIKEDPTAYLLKHMSAINRLASALDAAPVPTIEPLDKKR